MRGEGGEGVRLDRPGNVRGPAHVPPAPRQAIAPVRRWVRGWRRGKATTAAVAVLAATATTTGVHAMTDDKRLECSGAQTEVADCGLEDCSQGECRDCEWGEWSEFGDCTCEGLAERHRSISVQNNNCGTPCQGAKVETKACKPDCTEASLYFL